MRSSQISLGPTSAAQENWAVRKSRLLSDGQTTEVIIHIYHFDDEKGPCFDLDECTDLQKFASIHASFHNLFNSQRSLSKTQYFQAKPRCCSYRVALSYRLIEFTLPRLLMLALVLSDRTSRCVPENYANRVNKFGAVHISSFLLRQ